jgi:hypothetical protein
MACVNRRVAEFQACARILLAQLGKGTGMLAYDQPRATALTILKTNIMATDSIHREISHMQLVIERHYVLM